MVSFARVVLCEAILYATLLVVGGIMGWVKKKSTISLVAGSIAGIAVYTTVFFGWEEPSERAFGNKPFFVLAVTALSLMVVFFNRYVSGGRKFVPGGLMTLVSAGSFLLYMSALIVV